MQNEPKTLKRFFIFIFCMQFSLIPVALWYKFHANREKPSRPNFTRTKFSKQSKNIYKKKRPSKVLNGIQLIHDNASAHKAQIVQSFLKEEKLVQLEHPPYSPDLSPCDFFLFPFLKKKLSGRRYASRSALGAGIFQCLNSIPRGDYFAAFMSWIARFRK